MARRVYSHRSRIKGLFFDISVGTYSVQMLFSKEGQVQGLLDCLCVECEVDDAPAGFEVPVHICARTGSDHRIGRSASKYLFISCYKVCP